MTPLVSTVIPTFNRGTYLGETLESVLRQTYRNFEVIVVDDGSTDDTREVVARYQPGVRYVWQRNAERGAARNHGLRLARGEFVAFLDADDLWLPDKLECELERFRQFPEAGLVYGDAKLIDAQGRWSGRRRSPRHEGWVTRQLLYQNFVVLSAHLARTGAVRQAGGFREERELSGSEDWEFWVRLSTQCQFAHAGAATTCYRVHPANSMSNAAGMEQAMQRTCSVLEQSDCLSPPQRRLLTRRRAMIALTAAINYCGAGDYRQMRSRLLRAVRTWPPIALDARFSYTLLRALGGPRVSAALHALRSAGARRSGNLPGSIGASVGTD